MPFIWNDERSEYLDDSVEFDRNEFVVVRKLFIQFKEDAKEITENWIQENFQNYGQIEQIDLFRKENGAIWAYITFSDDKSAHSAFTAVSSSSNPVEIEKILPADTWHQPVSLEPIEQTTACSETEAMKQLEDDILKLNLDGRDNCEIPSNLLRRISASTSTLKETMKHQIERFAKKFTFILHSTYEPIIPLAEARSILRAIGPYVVDICVNLTTERWPRNIDRFYYKMCQYVGPNLKTLRMINVPNDEDWIQQLKPLLSRIESLYVTMCNYDFDFDIDFQSYCPNVKTLKIRMNMKGELLTKPWPKLEKLSIRDNQYMEERLVLEFMKNNPQLKYFKVAANDCENLLQQIPEHLPNLEKLCLYQAYPNISAENLSYLAEMKNLKKLKLMYLEEDEFDGIVACLPKFKQLQELKLHIFYDGLDTVEADELFQPNLDAIINLSQELHDLNCFHIRYCQINSDMLYNFIRNARNLQQIRVYRCGLEITDTILDSIESIRQSIPQSIINPEKLLIYADKISSEFNKEKIYRYVSLIKT